MKIITTYDQSGAFSGVLDLPEGMELLFLDNEPDFSGLRLYVLHDSAAEKYESWNFTSYPAGQFMPDEPGMFVGSYELEFPGINGSRVRFFLYAKLITQRE